MDAVYRCDEVLPFFRHDAVETLQGLKFYLSTLEEFIEQERSKEIDCLSVHANRVAPERQGEFWAWHYPVHWDDIFASQLRSSFLVTLISLAESHVGMVAEQACEIAATPLKPTDLRGALFERHRKCLESLAGFSRPRSDSWNSVYELRDIRNCIVHARSRVWEAKNEQRLHAIIAKLPGLSAPNDVLELASEFPVRALESVRVFIDELYEEALELCRRSTKRRA